MASGKKAKAPSAADSKSDSKLEPRKTLQRFQTALTAFKAHWSATNSTSAVQFNQLVSVYVETQNLLTASDPDSGLSSKAKEAQEAKLFDKANVLLAALKTALIDLSKEFKSVQSAVHAVQELVDRDLPLPFKSCSVEQYAEFGSEVLAMYRKESLVKHSLLQSLQDLHGANCAQETLELYVSSWLLEPFVDAERLAHIDRVMLADMAGSIQSATATAAATAAAAAAAAAATKRDDK